MLFKADGVVYLGMVEINGKNGIFKLAQFGCPLTYTSLDVFVPEKKLSLFNGNKNGDECSLLVKVVQRGYQKNITLENIEF